MLKKLLGLVLAAGLLAGCTVKGGIDYTDQLSNMPGVAKGKTISLRVQDNRPYVLSGDKSASFVGFVRDTYYMPTVDLTTNSERALGVDLLEAIRFSLVQGGATVTAVPLDGGISVDNIKQTLAKAGAQRMLFVSISEWKSDFYSFRDPLISYDISAKIYDQDGKLLGQNQLSARDESVTLPSNHNNIDNTAVAPAFRQKLTDLLNAPQIASALQ